HFRHRRAPRRGPTVPHVHQPLIAKMVHSLPQPPQPARRDPQDLGRPQPAVLLVHRPQEHFLDLHRPLHGPGRKKHRHLPRCLLPWARKADRSLALESGQMMCSLHVFLPLLTGAPAPRTVGTMTTPPPQSSSRDLDLGQGFRFFFEDPDWVKKILIGGVFMLLSSLIIGAIFVAGYGVHVLR